MRDKGFTLIELMIVVVIIAVLAAVAIIAYTKHIKSSRMTAERNFVSSIMAMQETYYQRFGQYHDTSGGVGSTGTPYPLGTKKYDARSFRPEPAGDNQPLWLELGALPEDRTTYFQWNVEASDPTSTPATGHVLYGRATQNGVPAQPVGATPHPWYYIEGHSDMDSNSADWTILSASSGRTGVRTINEGR